MVVVVMVMVAVVMVVVVMVVVVMVVVVMVVVVVGCRINEAMINNYSKTIFFSWLREITRAESQSLLLEIGEK